MSDIITRLIILKSNRLPVPCHPITKFTPFNCFMWYYPVVFYTYTIPLPSKFILPQSLPPLPSQVKAPSSHLVFSLLTSLPTSTLNPFQFSCHKQLEWSLKNEKSHYTTPLSKTVLGFNKQRINSKLLSTSYKALHNLLLPVSLTTFPMLFLIVIMSSHNGSPTCFWNCQAHAYLRVCTRHFLHLEHSPLDILMASSFSSFKSAQMLLPQGKLLSPPT